MTFKNHDAAYYEKAADILYGKTTPGEKRKPKERRYSLGQSIYDDEEEEETKKYSLDKPEEKENPEDILYNHPTSQPGYRQNSEKERSEKNKIKQPEYDDEEGIVTGGAADINTNKKKIIPEINVEEFVVDNIDNPFVKSMSYMIKGKEAAENLHMSKTGSYMNTKYAKNHLIFDNYKQTNSEWADYLKTKITGQIGADKLEKTKGIYINSNDGSSKAISKILQKNSDFRKLYSESREALNYNIPVNGSVSFNDKNFGAAIGLSDIRNMHFNKNGDLELYVADIYDFNKNDTRKLVKTGRSRQDSGEITPYFAIYNVIIPKDKL